MLLPKAGVPHALASTSILRERHVTPPPHFAEHPSQLPQLPHLPSTAVQPGVQDWVLQPEICVLSDSSQRSPNPRGAILMRRSRVFWPPLQLHVQPLQSVQSSQTQSWSLGQSVRGHDLVSFNSPVHGNPPFMASRVITRLLVDDPPHSHTSHAPQAESWHGTGAGNGAPLVSFKLPVQPIPPFFSWLTMVRLRHIWEPSLSPQTVHDVHWLRTQFCGVPRQCVAQRLVSIRAPSQGVPHSLLWTATERSRSQRPVQSVLLQSPHGEKNAICRRTTNSTRFGIAWLVTVLLPLTRCR